MELGLERDVWHKYHTPISYLGKVNLGKTIIQVWNKLWQRIEAMAIELALARFKYRNRRPLYCINPVKPVIFKQNKTRMSEFWNRSSPQIRIQGQI